MLKFFNILISTIFIALLLGVAGLLVGSMLPIPGNVEIKIVKSGSMEPAIPTGSLVVVKPSSSFSYKVGDIITFGPDTQSEIPTTHRIVAIEGTGSERIFITKGDANEEIDQGSVALNEVIGKVLVHVPGAGFVLDFARQPLGFALLIGLPAGLIILEELITIGKEARAALRRRRGEDDTPKGGAGSLDEDGAPMRFFYGRQRVMDEIFVPMYHRPSFTHAEWWHKQFRFHKDTYGTSTALVLGLVFMSSLMAGGAGGTIAYFSDVERSIGNVFRAGEWEPPVQIDLLSFAAALGATNQDTFLEESEPETEPGEVLNPEEDPTPEENPAPEGGGGGGSGGGGEDVGAPAQTGAPEEGAAGEASEEAAPEEEVAPQEEASETPPEAGEQAPESQPEEPAYESAQVPADEPIPVAEDPAPAPEPSAEDPAAETPAPEVI